MQIAIIPDVQGNLIALSGAIAEIEKLKESGRKIEKIYILGLLGYFPYPREVVELVKNSSIISAVRGKFDHLIARWSEIDEIEYPEYIIKTMEWNWKKLGKLRAWLRNELPAFLVENFGNNRFLFVYGDPFNPVNGEILPKKPTPYYEQFTSLKYDLIAVSGKEPFIAETRHGKIVCAGRIVGQRPTFAVVDTKTIDVSFFDFEFNRKSVEDKIKEEGLPEELIEILYRGY